MPKEVKARIVLSADRLHFQQYEKDGQLLTGDFWTKPNDFEFYYESVKDGSPIAVEIEWQHFFGVLRVLAERIAAARGIALS